MIINSVMSVPPYYPYTEKQASILGAIGIHKGLDFVANKVMRRGKTSKFFKPYYDAAVRSGFRSGFNHGEGAVLPRLRRAIGSISPSNTGLVDYELASELGHLSRKATKAIPFLKGMSPDQIAKHLSKDTLIGKAIKSRLGKSDITRLLNSENLVSPISKSIKSGISSFLEDPSKKKGIAGKVFDKTKGFVKRFGTGKDKQILTGTGGAAANAAVGAALHGPAGAIGAIVGESPNYIGSGLANAGKTSTLMKMKGKVLQSGRKPNSILNKITKAIDTSGGEFVDLGTDIANSKPSKLNPIGSFLHSKLEKSIDTMAARPLKDTLREDFLGKPLRAKKPFFGSINDTLTGIFS